MENKTAGIKPGYGLGRQITYGMAEFFNGGAFVIIGTYFTVFLSNAFGMPTALAGSIPLVGKIWDAITDPIMGNVTDRTESKFGAKRFYIMLGAIISALTFLLLWTAIPATNMAVIYFYYLCMFCLFSTGFTILVVPYNGLLPDMMDDYKMRAKFSNMRMVWSTLGSMVSGLLPAMFIKETNNKSQYFEVAVLFSVLFFITSFVTFLGTWEKQKKAVKTKTKDAFSQAVSVYRSRAFRLFIGIYLTGQCATDFVSGMAVYYVTEVLEGYKNGYFMYLMGVLLVTQLLGMAVFGPVMAATSKRTTILIGAPIRLAGTLGLLFFSYAGSPIVIVLLLTGLIGFGNAATLTSIFAIMADMADVDELITSVSRPGTVGGMATFARKVSSGLSAWIIGVLVSFVGYDSKLAKLDIRQSAATAKGIGIVYILAPAILIILLFIIGYRFPIAKKEFDVIKKEIKRRKGEDNSVATEEEVRICEKVTGFKYDKLWNIDNTKI